MSLSIVADTKKYVRRDALRCRHNAKTLCTGIVTFVRGL